MTRFEFLRSSVGMAAAFIGFAACGKEPSVEGDGTVIDTGNVDAGPHIDAPVTSSDAGIDGPPPSCAMNGTAVLIGANHGHAMTVPKADVAAGIEKTYDIQGTSAHPHSVTLTTAHFAKLANNEDVLTMSTDDGHAHSITVRCA